MTSHDKKGFLDLPAEVREMVYSLVFGNSTLTIEYDVSAANHTVQFSYTNRNLLRACRQIRAEATPIFEDRTRVHVGRGVISDFSPLDRQVLIPLQSFARNMIFTHHPILCQFRNIRLAGFQQLKRLEFGIVASRCCMGRAFGYDDKGLGRVERLKQLWTADTNRCFGLFRRINDVEVTETPSGLCKIVFNLNVSRTGRRRTGRMLISYTEDDD